MKRFIFLILSLSLSTVASAVTFEVLGQKGEILLKQELYATIPIKLGELSLQVFDRHHVPYSGGSYGFSSIFNMNQFVVVISDNEMKAYGWCFSVNSQVPDTMADETVVLEQKSVIQWFFGYAHYKDGQWILQCAKE